jgi:diguanylate cyclase (GGDEF)-like protein
VVTIISRFRVRNGLEEEVRSAFLNRPRLVEKAAGFCGLDVLTDAADSAVFYLVTRWTDEGSFRAWHRSEAHHESHAWIPKGLKLDASFTSLTVGNSIEHPGGTHHISDAIEGQTVALSHWLTDSDAVFALLLAPDGTIRERNRAGYRIFPPDPAREFGGHIWDYLVCADADNLRRRLSSTADHPEGNLLLNLTDGQRNPITLEACLIPCTGGMLLLATQETRHNEQLKSEIFRLTNDLSMMTRETVRKNRELKAANETIERLARTDALTRLANRRTLEETFPREIARTERLGGSLSVVMADLDHFKSINDQYGHQAGDQVLMRAAAVFGSQLRAYDLAARYGGEEFVLLLPETSTAEAAAIAERIREQVAKLEIPECPRQITISLGIATWIGGETSVELLARADAALYSAKRNGRNRVEAASTVQSSDSKRKG